MLLSREELENDNIITRTGGGVWQFCNACCYVLLCSEEKKGVANMQTKNPTRKQKQLLTKLRLNADNWLIGKETAEGLCIVHRHSGRTRVVPKGVME